MDSLRGNFLIASPHLSDGNFYRTVVLMIQHDDQGAMGVVLNRPMRNTVAEIWKVVGEASCSCPQPIHLGGPVSGPLLAVHTDEELSELKVLPGVFVCTHRDYLNRLVSDERGPFRIFTGYSGWAGGQLESELEQGGWLTAAATKEAVFSDQEELWKKTAADVGLEILSGTVPVRQLPADPSMN